jgi:hypothetical protein
LIVQARSGAIERTLAIASLTCWSAAVPGVGLTLDLRREELVDDRLIAGTEALAEDAPSRYTRRVCRRCGMNRAPDQL